MMRKNKNIDVTIERAILGVIKSLPSFEPDYISLLRRPGDIDKVRVHTLEEFIECRLNFEFFSIPEIYDYVSDFNGYLIRIVELQVPNDRGRRNRFTIIRAELDFESPQFIGEDLESDCNGLINFLGGRNIVITAGPRVPKIVIN